MNRIKRRIAVAKRHIELLEWCGIPFDGKKKRNLSRRQKLKIYAEYVFGWHRNSLTAARGTAKTGLQYMAFMYEMTGEWFPPPWAITDDETEGEDTT